MKKIKKLINIKYLKNKTIILVFSNKNINVPTSRRPILRTSSPCFHSNQQHSSNFFSFLYNYFQKNNVEDEKQSRFKLIESVLINFE